MNKDTLINDRYKIINSIGHGGMSDVYEARDIIFKRTVAIKVIKDEFVNNIENLIRFQNEARISCCLNHSNIIKVYDYGQIDNLPFIVNEFVKDQTLRDVLDYKRNLSVGEACLIMLQVCDAVIYLHNRKIIHRDLKPANIFYGADGSVKIGDFGISIVLNSTMNVNENNKVVGTAQYLAPEIIKGDKPSFQSDIYALGITFYEIVTGKVPFDADNPDVVARMQVKNIVPSPLLAMPNLPQDVETIIFKAVNKNLRERYQTVEEMRRDILILYSNKKAINKGHGILSRIFGLSSD